MEIFQSTGKATVACNDIDVCNGTPPAAKSPANSVCQNSSGSHVSATLDIKKITMVTVKHVRLDILVLCQLVAIQSLLVESMMGLADGDVKKVLN